MIQHASLDFVTESRLGLERTAFLVSHRAQSTAAREFTRLSTDVVQAARTIAAQRDIDPPTLRQSPDRCIVQMGPVALTVGYLRPGAEVPAGGQLLVIVWRGTIAPRGDHVPERGRRHTPAPPVPLWEESLIVSAEDESAWHWHPFGLEREGFTSTEVADRCATQLRFALDAAESPTGGPIGLEA